MRNFSTPLQKRHFQGATTGAVATTTVRKARPTVAPAASDLLTEPADWSADDLRAYVVRKVEELHGPQPDHTNTPKLAAIFRRFHEKYGREAGPIAVWVFETNAQPGRWKGSPVKVTRFAKVNDAYMADEVRERLR